WIVKLAVTQRRLMGDEDVDPRWNAGVQLRQVRQRLHEGPLHEQVRPWSQPDGQRTRPSSHRYRYAAVHHDLQSTRVCVCGHISVEGKRLAAPVVITPGEQPVRGRRIGQPSPRLRVEPVFLAIRKIPSKLTVHAIRT